MSAGIHVFLTSIKRDVDGRDKPGHDEKRVANSEVGTAPDQRRITVARRRRA